MRETRARAAHCRVGRLHPQLVGHGGPAVAVVAQLVAERRQLDLDPGQPGL